MSFGSGFGSNTGGGFGGFGANNNTTTSGSLFGSNTATAGSGGGFGFGNNNANSNPFGAPKTAGFGAAAPSTGGSLFGGGATSGGFGSGGGFGANNNAGGATLSTGFGGSNTGSSLFGANKTATTGFGATNTGGGSLFGGNAGGFGSNANNATSNPFGGTSNTTTGFGATNNSSTGGFGATGGSTFGGFGNNNNAANNAAVGTAATPFQAFTEKDGTAGQSAAYQSITMQAPYQGKSFEELRLEDYTQNHRFPQGNSFGSSNTFGGFNSTNNTTAARPSLFGAANTGGSFAPASSTGTGFGGTNTGGFGASNNATTGSSLFGQTPKPGGLFGNNNATTTTGGFGSNTNTTGGLFGSTPANNTSGGLFGQNNNTAATGTGGLFGNNNNAAKPGFGGGFGATNTATTNTGFGGGFGGTNNATTTQSGGLFGNNNTSGGFGATNNNTGGGLFGAAKPATTGGLFGAAAPANNTGGLFGGSAAPAASGGLFGNTQNNTAAGSSLFGGNNNTAKPGGLFGAPAANTGSSLFGGQNNNTQQSGGLFGGANNNSGGLFGQQKPANAFGGSTGGSLFGGSNTNTGGSLFNNQPAANNSLFGGSQGAGNNSLFASQGPQQNQLTASITGDPYGNAQLFASLAAPNPPVGPLATPLSGAKPAPKARASLLASVRGGSPMLGASTSLTPRGRPGYGFSYSTLNTPTGTPVLTPGASSLLRPAGSIGPGMSSRLSKSFSTSNLRGDGPEGTSLLRTPAPGQSSLLLGSGSLGSGSVRRLKIDRSLRTDLFGDTPKKSDAAKEGEKEPELRKRVSFDKSAEKDAATPTAKPSANNALVVREEENSTPKAPEMSQINPSLATVPEESGDKNQSPRRPVDAGEYYTEPSLKQIKSMSREQLKSLKSFIVGRQGVGKIEFGRDKPVDLTSVNIDDICGKIVQLKPRSATVYEDDSDKPSVGRGLNLPSTIWLEQSWPRASRTSSAAPQPTAQKDIDRHKARLKRVGGTKFLDYDDSTGIWSFTVEHFTTYELDDEEETTVNDSTTVDAAPPVEQAHSDVSSPIDFPDLGEQDDTFQFKLAQRSQQGNLTLPGGFDDSMANPPFDHDDASADEMQEDDQAPAGSFGDSFMIDPFLETADAVQPPSPSTIARYQEDAEMDEDKELPGSFHAEPDALKSILKPSTFDESLFRDVDHFADLSWEDQLQRTLSPKKRDRQALRDMQVRHAEKGPAESDSLLKKSLLTRSQLGASHLATKSARKQTNGTVQPSEAFTTSMDIMRSLWADAKQGPTTRASQARRGDGQNSRDDKPASVKNTIANTGQQKDIKGFRASSSRDENGIAMLKLQQTVEHTTIEIDDMDMDDEDEDGPIMPEATTSNRIILKQVADAVNSDATHEKHIWELCSVLFDSLEVSAADLIQDMDDGTINELQGQIRRDVFLTFWNSLITKGTQEQIRQAKVAEEKAILYLCLGDILAASEVLMAAGNPRLAIQVAQLPASDVCRDVMKKQIEDWQSRKDWSEFSSGQQALYSILAGNTASVAGTPKAAPEDRTADFDISAIVGLTWQQCLALRVRYSGEESLPHAIDAYVNALKDGVEIIKPVAWQGQARDREDTLLALLKLITEQASADSLLDPLAVSGNAAQHRLAWQLATMLSSRNMLHCGDDELDKLTLDLSAELENTGDYLDALWVLLHLNDSESRYSAIKEVLERNGSKIPDPVKEGKTGDFEFITVDLLIPASLAWSAKALHAKDSLQDAVLQCKYLLNAGTQESLQEAHDVLCQKVGPIAVIEQYYDDVAMLTERFADIGGTHFDGWTTGGLLYLQLCQLLSTPANRSRGRDYEALLKKLDKGLKAQQDAAEQGLTLEMRVARIEMRKIVTAKAKLVDDSEKWYNGVAIEAAKFNKGMEMYEQYKQALSAVH